MVEQRKEPIDFELEAIEDLGSRTGGVSTALSYGFPSSSGGGSPLDPELEEFARRLAAIEPASNKEEPQP